MLLYTWYLYKIKTLFLLIHSFLCFLYISYYYPNFYPILFEFIKSKKIHKFLNIYFIFHTSL